MCAGDMCDPATITEVLRFWCPLGNPIAQHAVATRYSIFLELETALLTITLMSEKQVSMTFGWLWTFCEQHQQ